MKIYIGKPRDHWISPFTIMDYAFWWTDWSKCSRDRRIRSLEEERDYVEHPAWVERWSDRLTPVSRAIQWILDRVHPSINLVKIDYWDTWSMDHALSPVILPMLKQLKATQHGAGFVDDDDVPDHLKSTAAPAKENEWDTDANHFARWDYVLNEMIFAFEHKADDSWEDAFRSGEHDLISVPCEWDTNGRPTMYQMKEGPNNTYKCDYEGMQVVEARIQNGFRLFGRYFQNLWD
jgi:hypothetical protein